MSNNFRLWRLLGLVFVLSFGALGFIGYQIYLTAPPIPTAVVTAEGDTLFTSAQIQAGQQAWLSAGGQQLGTVWGHGSYVAPDWSADWLHREATALQSLRERRHMQAQPTLTSNDRAAIATDLRVEMRRNTYEPERGVIIVSTDRAAAIRETARHYTSLFGSDPALAKLREQYAMSAGALPAATDREALAAFFFWTAWSATTDRPGESGLSYTSNWPHEPLVGNTMTGSAAMWSMASIVLLIACLGAMLWFHGSRPTEAELAPLGADPFRAVSRRLRCDRRASTSSSAVANG